MKVIAATGGKGGVGKSTVSILLANKLRNDGQKVVLCDCDVECPNDYLLSGLELEKPAKKVLARFPKLDESKCSQCGLCARKCRSNAIFKPPNQFPIFLHELCSGCGLCWKLCPNGAIEVEEKAIGEIFSNQLGSLATGQSGWLVTGRSIGVVEETGPIVTETRKFAERLAREVEADFLLLDTAPGMHCGVIRALIGVDLAYAVTESTPLGAHDLKLILQLLRELEVPSKIVLNQADLGDRKPIDEIAGDFGVSIEHEIPYSRKMVEAYSSGQLGNLSGSWKK